MNARVWDGAGRRIHMQEVGTRDGLQVEERFVETADKIALVDALSDAGLAKIEVTSFVSPKAIPQLRDAEIVLREIRRAPGTVYTALVPNVRGAERAIESRADELNLVMSASNSDMEPASARRSPVTRLNSVVLPAPFGPMIRRRSPGATSRETPLIAGRPPNAFFRSLI